jgi:SAM-dependent methyltransferase
MDAWGLRLEQALSTTGGASTEPGIGQLVALASELADAGEAHLDANPSLLRHAPRLRAAYQGYIADMEQRAAASLLDLATSPGGFAERTDDGGRAAYRRVDDLFERIDFRPARRFVMVGCGRFPATALQAAERFPGLAIVALDTDDEALGSARTLAAALGLANLDFRHEDGARHDFGAADIAFVANMVSPKRDTVARALATGGPGLQLVVREPYGLGRLWADRAEDSLGEGAQVAARGPGSPYLSRNVFLTRGPSVD